VQCGRFARLGRAPPPLLPAHRRMGSWVTLRSLRKAGSYLRDIRKLMNEITATRCILRTFWAWLRPHACQLRLESEKRNPKYSESSACGNLVVAMVVALGRAW